MAKSRRESRRLVTSEQRRFSSFICRLYCSEVSEMIIGLIESFEIEDFLQRKMQ